MAFLAWVPGPWEIALLAIVALLLFGRRLPEVGRSLGKGIVEFKKGLHEAENEITKPQDTNSNKPSSSSPSQPPTSQN